MDKCENPYDLEKRMAELEAIERRASEEARYDLNMEIQELKDRIEHDCEDEYDESYTPSSTYGDYSPGNPWDAPGMSINDFIR